MPDISSFANDNPPPTLTIKTNTREELIDVSRVIANAFDRRFFQDPDNIPFILIPGFEGGGKSMMVEAMMKTLLDEYDPEDIKKAFI